MKSVTWWCLSLILAGSAYYDVSWASRGHNHFGGHAHRGAHRHFTGGHRASFGIGHRGGHRSYRGGHHFGGRYAYRGRHRSSFYGGLSFGYGYPLYGSFGYGYPVYGAYYRRPYYWGGHFNSVFFLPPAVPPVYIQQPVIIQPSSPAVVTRANYWHYCEQPAGYYPQVKNCQSGWIQVPPRHGDE